jgi:ubiquinone biosynthesis protein
MVRRFKISLTRELDLAAECHHAERITASFSTIRACFAVGVLAVHERADERAGFRGRHSVADLPALEAAGVVAGRSLKSGRSLF